MTRASSSISSDKLENATVVDNNKTTNLRSTVRFLQVSPNALEFDESRVISTKNGSSIKLVCTFSKPNRNTQHKLALNENVLWIKVIRAFLVGHFSEGIPKTLKCKWEFSLKTGKFSVKLG